MKELSDAKNSYIIDIENATETVRLIEQSQLFTAAMGGVFPPELDLSQVLRVLDLGCGPGQWVHQVAFEYQDREVVGIDLNKTMVDYAMACARAQGLDNTSFEVMVRRIGDEERVQQRMLELMERSMHTPLTLPLERGRRPEHVEKAA